MNTIAKAKLLQKRRWRIRQKIAGTAARPRLSVKFSGKHIYAQAVNDDTATTLVFFSSVAPEVREQHSKPTSPARRRWARRLPPRPRRPASPGWSSTATAAPTTAR